MSAFFTENKSARITLKHIKTERKTSAKKFPSYTMIPKYINDEEKKLVFKWGKLTFSFNAITKPFVSKYI